MLRRSASSKHRRSREITSRSSRYASSRPVRARARDRDVEALLIKGEPTALFYQALRKRLRVIVRHEIARTRGFLSPDEIEDLLQELLVSVWRVDLARFDPTRGSLMAFLRKRVRWQVANTLRKCVRQNEVYKAAPRQNPSDPHVHIESRERVRLLRNALDEVLAPRDADAALIIRAHDIEGIAMNDIALCVGVHPSQITRIRRRGLDTLRRFFESAQENLGQ